MEPKTLVNNTLKDSLATTINNYLNQKEQEGKLNEVPSILKAFTFPKNRKAKIERIYCLCYYRYRSNAGIRKYNSR